MFKKFNLSISLLGLLLLCSCSKIPNSAYICFDIQSDKKVFMLTYHKGMGVVSSDSELTSDDFSSDWVADGLSRYNKDDWYSDRNNPIQEENGIVIEYFDFMNVTMENDSLEFILPEFKDFTFTKGNKKGQTYNLPLNNHRNTYFDLATNNFEIYEYSHPWRVTMDYLKDGEDWNGFNIIVTFNKKFECFEDKEIYKRIYSS